MSAPVGEPAKRQRRRRFKVERRYDGASGIRVEVVVGGEEPLVRVRLKGRRRVVEYLLGDVAVWLLERDSKARAAARAAEKAAKRKSGRRSRRGGV